MAKTTAKRPERGGKAQRETREAKPPQEGPRRAAGRRTTRKATNLTLDPAAVMRGEAYRSLHGMGSLSQLVNALLGALPNAEVGPPARPALAPAVRRLLGVARPLASADDAAGGGENNARTAYRAHLDDKYGGAA